jgi:hypothetical protein
LGRLTCDDKPSIQWTFAHSKANHCDGYIIQRVRLVCSGKTCATNKDAGKEATYWEAWALPNGQQQVVDTAAWEVRKPPSVGHYEQDGEVRFYCAEKTGPGLLEDNPDWQGVNELGAIVIRSFGTGICQTNAGTLIATNIPKEAKRIWMKTPDDGPSQYRTFWVNFCCCNDPRDTFPSKGIVALASPYKGTPSSSITPPNP